MSALPVLYSFRRCPYAMRARMAMAMAKIPYEKIEVELKNKPDHMLQISPKGTVPVLWLEDTQVVIEESLDIMRWALEQNDPECWLSYDRELGDALIEENDGAFKRALDRYKYPSRYPDEDCSGAKGQALQFLEKLNDLLESRPHLLLDRTSLIDIAIFPFIRQCANVDRGWFDGLALPHLQDWLGYYLDSALFSEIMRKE